MDRTGPMPIKVWVQIHDDQDLLLETLQARIDGGTVTIEFPAFPPGTLGRITRFDQFADGEIFSSRGELELLPAIAIVEVSEEG